MGSTLKGKNLLPEEQILVDPVEQFLFFKVEKKVKNKNSKAAYPKDVLVDLLLNVPVE